jgi:hypothetical protein
MFVLSLGARIDWTERRSCHTVPFRWRTKDSLRSGCIRLDTRTYRWIAALVFVVFIRNSTGRHLRPDKYPTINLPVLTTPRTYQYTGVSHLLNETKRFMVVWLRLSQMTWMLQWELTELDRCQFRLQMTISFILIYGTLRDLSGPAINSLNYWGSERQDCMCNGRNHSLPPRPRRPGVRCTASALICTSYYVLLITSLSPTQSLYCLSL